jgi:TPR repeat protein
MELSFLGRWFGRPQKPGRLKPDAGIVSSSGSGASLSEHPMAGPVASDVAAMRACREAAERGEVEAQFNLALMYVQGKGVLRDQAAALTWFRRAAEKSHAGAQYHLGVRLHCVSKGSPEPQSAALRIEAFQWLRLAEAQSYPGAAAALEFVVLAMTRKEVSEAGQPEMLGSKINAISLETSANAPTKIT